MVEILELEIDSVRRNGGVKCSTISKVIVGDGTVCFSDETK
jgi:hypothetical protein